MKQEKLIKSKDLYYPGIIANVKKSKEHLQPIFEAFTNSIESIKLLNNSSYANGVIKIDLFLNRGTTDETFIFDKIVVEDNGIGFDEKNFDRIKRYRDNRKGYSNRGTGRFQLLHFFDSINYESIFREENTFKMRKFTLSKRFADKDAIILLSLPDPKVVSAECTKTVLTMEGLLDKKEDEKFYDKITASDLKKKIISRYMMDFCLNRDKLPEIRISDYINGVCDNTVLIAQDDISPKDKEDKIVLNYSKLSIDGKRFEKTKKQEELTLTSFVIEEQNLEENEIKLTSKGELALNPKIELAHLTPKDSLNKKRYLFLLSGDYLNRKDGDERGNLRIPTRDDFKKANSEVQDMFDKEEIFLEDIQEKTNEAVLSFYDEIKDKTQAKKKDIEKLETMFLLNKETISAMSFALDDTEEEVLKKVYMADVKITAQKDACIKKRIDELDKLNPAADNYRQKFNSITSELVKAIPLQNRTALAHYVARRKLVLDLFQKILDNELVIQKESERNIDEKLLHSLIFQQSSDNPDESDLWLVNEDFIYFKGCSNKPFCDVEIDGQKILKPEFSSEEEKYLLSLGENRKIKKPDVLLFPDESKCIIIEFKNPEVNVSVHLNQINTYASLMRNFSSDSWQIDTFYGYLIGEQISVDDVRFADGDFKNSYHFNYLFRPSKTIVGINSRADGSLYTEVIKYSTLLKRAYRRNEIFIKKLMLSEDMKKDTEKNASQETTQVQESEKIKTENARQNFGDMP